MSQLTPPVPHAPTRITVEEYFRLVETGDLAEDDRVELLEGVIVSMPPSGPPHASVVAAIGKAFTLAVGDRAAVRVQLTFVIPPFSAPEPDVAIVPGSHLDYWTAHPSQALLIVEVADSSLAQDRLAKSRIYAAAGVPEYWIVNLRHGAVEVLRDPDPPRATYRSAVRCGPGERIALAALPGVEIDLADLVPQSFRTSR